jgi:hypothetical protein
VRAEALQGVVERAEPIKRDEGDGEPRAAAV